MITESGKKVIEFKANDICKKVWLNDGRYGILINFRNGDKIAEVGKGRKFIEVKYDEISIIED